MKVQIDLIHFIIEELDKNNDINENNNNKGM